MLVFAQEARSFLNDPWTFALVVIAIVGAGLSLAFYLGWNLSRLSKVEDKQRAQDDVIVKIFARLDELAKCLPHVCQQTQKIADINLNMALMKQELVSVENWRHALEEQRSP